MAQSKKDFTAEAAGVFVGKMITPEAEPGSGQTKPAAKKQARSKAAGEVKVCFCLDTDTERKVRYIAFAERIKQKTILTEALQQYVAAYEAAHGRIK